MKRLMTLVLILTALFAWACAHNDYPAGPGGGDIDTTIIEPPDTTTPPPDTTIIEPPAPTIQPEIRLVPVSGQRSTSSLGDSPLTSSDSTVSSIDFGDVVSTRTRSYVLMNTGNVDLYDIAITADSLGVWPSEIGVLEANTGRVSSLPLLDVTIPHVIPLSGVGANLPMNLGEFVDTLRLSFTYDDTSGPVSREYAYPVTGDRLGGKIDVYSADGKNVGELWTTGQEMGARLGLPYTFRNIDVPVDSIDWSSFLFVNSGNIDLPLSVYNRTLDSVLVDTTLAPSDSLVVVGAISLPGYGNFYFWSGPTEYLIECFMGVETDGFVGFSISQD